MKKTGKKMMPKKKAGKKAGKKPSKPMMPRKRGKMGGY